MPEMSLEEFVAAVTASERRTSDIITSLEVWSLRWIAQGVDRGLNNGHGGQDPDRHSTLGVPNVLVLSDLGRASLQVQAQVLEVGCGRRWSIERWLVYSSDG